MIVIIILLFVIEVRLIIIILLFVIREKFIMVWEVIIGVVFRVI